MNKIVSVPSSTVWVLDNVTNAALRAVLYGLLSDEVELTGRVHSGHLDALLELARDIHDFRTV